MAHGRDQLCANSQARRAHDEAEPDVPSCADPLGKPAGVPRRDTISYVQSLPGQLTGPGPSFYLSSKCTSTIESSKPISTTRTPCSVRPNARDTSSAPPTFTDESARSVLAATRAEDPP